MKICSRDDIQIDFKGLILLFYAGMTYFAAALVIVGLTRQSLRYGICDAREQNLAFLEARIPMKLAVRHHANLLAEAARAEEEWAPEEASICDGHLTCL